MKIGIFAFLSVIVRSVRCARETLRRKIEQRSTSISEQLCPFPMME